MNELKGNPYIKNIKISLLKEGNFEFSQNKFKKYEIFVCDGFYDELINTAFPVIGYVDEEFNKFQLRVKSSTSTSGGRKQPKFLVKIAT